MFGAAYDDGGRLKEVTYPTFSVTYSYNTTTGLLERVSDSFTNYVNFYYDDDRRVTGISRSNGVYTTLTWDAGNRLTRIQDNPSIGSGLIDLQYTLDAAGQVTQVNMTAPLDPSGFLTAGMDSFTYDAASRVSTSGYAYDNRGRLTTSPDSTYIWDGAPGLIGINSTTLTYNGWGDLITRTEDGKTMKYYYNYALGLTPIVSEMDEVTGIVRYYIWTPGGRLLYMIDAANNNKVYFYHFDFSGSTLALTDSTGAVTDKYAYDPYGELLSHQGTNQQPFTFLGRWGIRQECPSTGSGCGTLYHIRARYYDAVTQRFLSRDPVWPLIADPIQLNPYQYGGNEPIAHLDIAGGPEVYNDLWKYDPTNNNWGPVTPPGGKTPTEATGQALDQRFKWVEDLMREWDKGVGQGESAWKESTSVLSTATPCSKVSTKIDLDAPPLPRCVPKTQVTQYICVPGGSASNYNPIYIRGEEVIVPNMAPVATCDIVIGKPTGAGDILKAQKKYLLEADYDPTDNYPVSFVRVEVSSSGPSGPLVSKPSPVHLWLYYNP